MTVKFTEEEMCKILCDAAYEMDQFSKIWSDSAEHLLDYDKQHSKGPKEYSYLRAFLRNSVERKSERQINPKKIKDFIESAVARGIFNDGDLGNILAEAIHNNNHAIHPRDLDELLNDENITSVLENKYPDNETKKLLFEHRLKKVRGSYDERQQLRNARRLGTAAMKAAGNGVILPRYNLEEDKIDRDALTALRQIAKSSKRDPLAEKAKRMKNMREP